MKTTLHTAYHGILILRDGNHYYAYGGLIGDLCTGQEEQEFKFGDKKLDRTYGLDLYDFEARQYDAIAPWFTSIDPLAETYYSISPYAYCAGDPVNLVDPTGCDTLNVTGSYDENNNWIWSINYRAGGDVEIVNVTDAQGNTTSTSFDKDQEICQVKIDEASNCTINAIKVKNKEIYGFAFNPAGDPSIYEGSHARPYSGCFLLESNNEEGLKWRCAGPRVFGIKIKEGETTVVNRRVRIHYAGNEAQLTRKDAEDVWTEVSQWTQACSVVAPNYKVINGAAYVNPLASYNLYASIQGHLGGKPITYTFEQKIKRGFYFPRAINKYMQIK